MRCEPDSPERSKIIDFARRRRDREQSNHRVVRVCAENDGLCLLYSNDQTDTNKLFSMPILCWSLSCDGEVHAMIPWLNRVVRSCELSGNVLGQWRGYYHQGSRSVFFRPPEHKVLELKQAQRYFAQLISYSDYVQEIPDSIGTHAMLGDSEENAITLLEVISWRLLKNGHLQALVADEHAIESTPILPGDPCLYPVESHRQFRYYFQHNIANQIKAHQPEALQAIALLLER